jgi:hypothetical protein
MAQTKREYIKEQLLSHGDTVLKNWNNPREEKGSLAVNWPKPIRPSIFRPYICVQDGGLENARLAYKNMKDRFRGTWTWKITSESLFAVAKLSCLGLIERFSRRTPLLSWH